MQTRTHSLIEAVANIIAGYFVAVGGQIVIFPWFGMSVALHENLTIGLFFTVLSLVRSYGLRRVFARWHDRSHP